MSASTVVAIVAITTITIVLIQIESTTSMKLNIIPIHPYSLLLPLPTIPHNSIFHNSKVSLLELVVIITVEMVWLVATYRVVA